MFAKESKAAPSKAVEMAPKPSRDKPAEASAKKDVGNDKPAAGTPAVADSGKTLPAKPPAKADAAASSDDDKSADKDLAQANHRQSTRCLIIWVDAGCVLPAR